MKPHRIRMTHNLLINYGLYEKMEIFVSERKKERREKKCFFIIFQSFLHSF